MRLAGANLDRVTAYDTDEDTELAAVCASAALRRPTLAVIDSWAAWVTDGDNNSPEAVRGRFRALLPLQRVYRTRFLGHTFALRGMA